MAATDDHLSPRERDVLRLLAAGHTNREVADLLCISVRTAETHRASIRRKLGADTHAALVRHAIEAGLFSAVGASANLADEP
jgi:DNA-binding CsgD family transcriptional regulator